MRRLAPPILLLACLCAMALLRWRWPLSVFVRPPLGWAGMLPLLSGLALIVAGLRRFRRSRTTIKPFGEARRLVTDGIFHYTRNPIYLGEVLILLGAWVLMGAVSPVVAVGAYALIAHRWFVRAEEAMLLAKFGQEYRDYCRRTRKWI